MTGKAAKRVLRPFCAIIRSGQNRKDGLFLNKVVDINDFAAAQAANRARNVWRKIFPEPLERQTRLCDLSGRTLLDLARLGREMQAVIYDLIMSIQGHGGAPKTDFDSLASKPKLEVLDASLFLIDQVRWECLGRLGWVRGYAAEQYPLIDLVLEQKKIKAGFKPPFPHLCDSHPAHAEFQKRRNIDGESMIRALIPTALVAFEQII